VVEPVFTFLDHPPSCSFFFDVAFIRFVIKIHRKRVFYVRFLRAGGHEEFFLDEYAKNGDFVKMLVLSTLCNYCRALENYCREIKKYLPTL